MDVGQFNVHVRRLYTGRRLDYRLLRPMSHLQFIRASLSLECATKSCDKVASVSVQHSVHRVAQNTAELYSEIRVVRLLKTRATRQVTLAILSREKTRATKLREKIAGVTSV